MGIKNLLLPIIVDHHCAGIQPPKARGIDASRRRGGGPGRKGIIDDDVQSGRKVRRENTESSREESRGLAIRIKYAYVSRRDDEHKLESGIAGSADADCGEDDKKNEIEEGRCGGGGVKARWRICLFVAVAR